MREDDNVKFSYHVPPQTTPQNITPNAMPSPATIHYSLFALHFAENYAFSAKERDAETGLSYFGARYYSSDLSIWLSVDPMSGKYPSLSPYVYCADNPVKLVDPNGEEVRDKSLKAVRARVRGEWRDQRWFWVKKDGGSLPGGPVFWKKKQ